MDTIANLKEQAAAQTPLVLFDVVMPDGTGAFWSTHDVVVDSTSYDARVIRHNFFEIQSSSGSGIDAIPRISFALANADSRYSQLETAIGFKGARVTARFAFYDLASDTQATPSRVVFQGMLNPPDEITEEAIRLSAINRMSMQRVLLPPVRIQRRCPWNFPGTSEERIEAINGGPEGRFSRFYRCGYSAGELGGVGNLDGSSPFTTCGLTRDDCTTRGMFDVDGSQTLSRRFGGIEFVPASILVRGHGSKRSEVSAVAINESRYNDFVPLAYGVVWIDPPVVFARNDGNLTRMEVLLTAGEIQGIRTVLVNDVEIPIGVAGQDMTASGWWNLFSSGSRTGGFNYNFTRDDGTPLGDPYGSMAAMSIVVPNQIHNGTSVPRVRVLLEGNRVETFDALGASLGHSHSDNPAWILLDVLRHSGWRLSELDTPSFATAASVCEETIASVDNQGNSISIPRFQCNLLLRSRRPASDVIRSIRNSARLQLTYQDTGLLSVFVEDSLLRQQPQQVIGSNAPAMVNGGWPAYAYVDGSVPGLNSAIVRRPDGKPTIRMWSHPIADTPNRYSIEFSDQFNEFQQDSLALTDMEDVARTGQEITGRLVADGIASFDQAARILKFFLDRALKGNRYIEFETTVKAIGQRVGNIITVTYLKEGLSDQPFRILKIEPGRNYQMVRITAQVHDDAWYNDTNGQLTLAPATERAPTSDPRIPDPLYGDELDGSGRAQFSVGEKVIASSDGGLLAELAVGFIAPSAGRSLAVGTPTVSLQPTVLTTGGSLEGGQTLYYSVTAVDGDGIEGSPSFVVRADIPPATSTNVVRLDGLRFHRDSASFNVYRGPLPSKLFRIANQEPVASQFSDDGLVEELSGAPDPNFDHANFYWRFEDLDELFASVFGPAIVGSSSLNMTAGAFVGHAVRLLRGKGAGQEREVVANDATSLTVTPPWQAEPDESTVFVVAENTWRFGGQAETSPARFQVPNLRDRVVQIIGRAANARNVESLQGLGLLRRWRIGGGGLGVADTDTPPQPSFGLAAPGDGSVELSAIGFPQLANTQSISSGVIRLFYRHELDGVSQVRLDSALDGNLHDGGPQSSLFSNRWRPTPGRDRDFQGECDQLGRTPIDGREGFGRQFGGRS